MIADSDNPNVDIDRVTGGNIYGWDHVVQSVVDIMSTRFGERVMRRWYGSLVPQFLGNNLTAPVVVQFFAAIGAALEQEPRIRLIKLLPVSVSRTGRIEINMSVEYRPRALLGDYTAEGYRQIATSLPWTA